MPRPIALFGGTFDPVHNGHLAVAAAALRDPRFHLDEIVFVPAHIPPHKQERAIAPYADRFAMLKLALAVDPRFSLSSIEDPATTAGKPHFSIDTVRRFKQLYGLSSKDLYFIVGMDSFRDLPKWRQPSELLKECRFLVATRPGFTERSAAERSSEVLAYIGVAAEVVEIFFLETVFVDVSATAIRSAASRDGSLEGLVPGSVADYIRAHKLYR